MRRFLLVVICLLLLAGAMNVSASQILPAYNTGEGSGNCKQLLPEYKAEEDKQLLPAFNAGEQVAQNQSAVKSCGLEQIQPVSISVNVTEINVTINSEVTEAPSQPQQIMPQPESQPRQVMPLPQGPVRLGSGPGHWVVVLNRFPLEGGLPGDAQYRT